MPEPALRRLPELRAPDAERVKLSFEGEIVDAVAGESLAAALGAAQRKATRRSARLAAPRTYYCGMGVCWECVVDIAGQGLRRACMTEVADGMVVRSVEAGAAG